MENILPGIILIVAGIFSMIGALANWNFFFNDPKAKPIVSIFGRQGARIFYIIVGAAFSIGGIAFIFYNLK